MTTFGITAQGLFVPTFEDLREDVNQRLRDLFGSIIDLSDESVESQFSAIVNERLKVVWDLLEVLYNGIDPDAANGVLLDAISVLTGTFRRAATFSVVTITSTGDPTTTVPGGSLVSGTGEQFVTIGDATIEDADVWVELTDYVEGDLVTNADNIYVAAADGTSGDAGGPVHTGRGDDVDGLVADGDMDWIWIGAGTGSIDHVARAVSVGVRFRAAYAVDTIDTPVGGWTGIANQLDTVTGAEQQNDQDLRIARDAEITALGTSPPDALRARLLRVGIGTNDPVIAATVFTNVTDVTDGDGLLPHSIEALVRGGDADAIRSTLWASVAGGIRTVGTVTGIVVDSQGRDQTIKFSRPEELAVYAAITLIKDPDEYPSDGDDQVAAAIVAYGDAQAAGKDVVASALIGAVFRAVPGVLDVTVMHISTAPGPTLSTTIPVSLRQLATYDTSRIAVTSSDGTP